MTIAAIPLRPPQLSGLPVQWLPERLYTYPTCVYFLVKGSEVVYIGQSISMLSRAESHKKNPEKDFDEIFCLPIREAYLNEVEGAFIRHFKPKLNGRSKTGKILGPAGLRTDEQILSFFGLVLTS
jgi:hypothetical protein